MLKIGRYRLGFGKFIWFQTTRPVKIKHWWRLWLFKEACPWDIDKKEAYPLNSKLEYEGRRYRYWKAGEEKP